MELSEKHALMYLKIDNTKKNKKNAEGSSNYIEESKQDGMSTENRKIKITIVRNSQLRFLKTDKMLNDLQC